MFWLIKTVIVGAIVGALAKWIMPGRQAGGFWLTALLGIAGAFVATMIGRFAGFYEQGEAAGWILSVLGAVLLLWSYQKFNAPKG